MLRLALLLFITISLTKFLPAQEVSDTIPKTITDSIETNVHVVKIDSTLRIRNLNPFFTLHVDSTLNYQFEINRDSSNYYWYLKNSPVGLRINKDNGLLTFKAEKSYFLSGKLKYDAEYKVMMGVQNLLDPLEKADTSFTLIFYNTEIIPSHVKPTVSSRLTVSEGEPVSFNILCETGSFPIEEILYYSSTSINETSLVKNCGDKFSWTPDYDFVKETDSAKVKIVELNFIGSTKFKVKDTATVRVIVKDALNYPYTNQQHQLTEKSIKDYILDLKYAFLVLDKRLKKTKSTRTAFDLTSGSTALAGTVLNTSDKTNVQKAGKVMPSIGIALVPVKEAASPNKVVEQNQASVIRTSIKRLEYMIQDNMLVGEKDPDVVKKTNKLKDELKQIQIQLIDLPIAPTSGMSPEELNEYFTNPKVNKKYRLKGK